MSDFGSNQYSKWRLVAFLGLLAYLPVAAQTIENVRDSFDQSKQLVYIFYDLKGLSYKKEIKITPYIESGNASLPNMQSLTGDFDWVNRGGKSKVVIWDPFKDGISSLEGIRASIKTDAEVRKAVLPRFRCFMLHGSNSAPLGIKYVQLSPVGFFAGFRMGKFPPSYTYTVTNTGEIDYPESGVYEIGTEKRLAGFAFTAGPTFQIGRNMYAYAGAGYGAEQLFWEYQKYNSDYDLQGSEWALNESINSKGVAVDAGIVMRFGRVLLDIGGGTIQFKSYQITGGVGWAFVHNKKP